ncbi:MAG TPA: hypothetical protein VFG04_23280 [Planctomycetaceae bacterium]|jgi:hypothetical protein|nr:hypothetical protein [Planctomycetaceae bacterium]
MRLSTLRVWMGSWAVAAFACTAVWGTQASLRADDVPQKDLSPPAAAAPDTPSAASTIGDPLAEQVQQAIEVTSRRFLETEVHTPWQIVHGLLAYRRGYMVKQNGVKVNALDWVASGPVYKDQPWFEKMPYGAHAHPYNNVPYAFQGHPNQFMAYMTMCDLPLDYKLKTSSGEMATINDFINGAKMEVNDREEITWTLWFLSHYIEPTSQWINKDGQPWSMERLVQIENGKVVTSAACGGTHGLFALAYARNAFRESGGTLYGPWFEADQKVQRYLGEARANQNADGTFSSNYFQGPGASTDFVKRIGTTGHILEFVCVAVPRSTLHEDWVRRAVAALAHELIENRQASAECGALYHAVDGLSVYRTRMWPELDPAHRSRTAAKPVSPVSSDAPPTKAVPAVAPVSAGEPVNGRATDASAR